MEKRKENARYLNQCFTMMVLLNCIIVLFLAFTIVLTQYRVAAAQEAQQFIETLKVMPERPEQKIIMVVFSLCFLCGIIYYKRRNEEEGKEKDSVKVGESFENDGLKVTAKKAEFGYDGGEYFTPKDGCEYVAVDFTCENIAEKGDKYVSVSDCECYADNSACEQQYIGGSDFVNTNLSPGKNVSFTAYYEVPKDAKKVILEYSASFWTDKKITINLK